MLVVVSNAVPVQGEAGLIRALFDAGLEVFHLRKPGYTEMELNALLRSIHPDCYPRIALHQHHGVADAFGIKRLHFTEQKRLQTDFTNDIKDGKTYSTSIHSLADYHELEVCFEYAFLGPVFNSISKSGYQAMKDPELLHVKTQDSKRSLVKLVAIGGITTANCQTTRHYGYDGIAALGAIWQSENPVQNFKNIQQAWNTAGQ